ncbi:MAG: DNA-directed RNA polymerase, subunit E'' [Desulfurococcales archaeon]|nr:DNA-directed RNA polymerase, subunit E'' [Desulfurococcales archaeon]
MPSRRPPSRRPPLKACRRCGGLVDREARVCPYCGSAEFTDNWEGMIIILDSENSVIAKETNINREGMFAIKVAGRIVKR